MTDISEILLAQAQLGRKVEDWFATDVGRYVLGRLEQEQREAMDALKHCSSWRRQRIVELQNRIWRAESVQQWLAELISEGRQAAETLTLEDDND